MLRGLWEGTLWILLFLKVGERAQLFLGHKSPGLLLTKIPATISSSVVVLTIAFHFARRKAKAIESGRGWKLPERLRYIKQICGSPCYSWFRYFRDTITTLLECLNKMFHVLYRILNFILLFLPYVFANNVFENWNIRFSWEIRKSKSRIPVMAVCYFCFLEKEIKKAACSCIVLN